MGHLLGKLIRRSTDGKQGMKQFAAEEIAGPLGADFQIGAAEEDWQRVAPVTPPPSLEIDLAAMDPASLIVRTLMGPPPDALQALRPEWRRADISAVNGHGNARSLARVLSTITLGGAQLLSPDTIDKIFDVQADGTDLVLGIQLCFRTGYALTSGGTSHSAPWLPKGKRVCFWGRWGGSICIMDLDRKLTFCYVMKKMAQGILDSERTEAYVRAAYMASDVEDH